MTRPDDHRSAVRSPPFVLHTAGVLLESPSVTTDNTTKTSVTDATLTTTCVWGSAVGYAGHHPGLGDATAAACGAGWRVVALGARPAAAQAALVGQLRSSATRGRSRRARGSDGTGTSPAASGL